MKKIYILSTIWMAFIVGACDYNDKNFDGLDDERDRKSTRLNSSH